VEYFRPLPTGDEHHRRSAVAEQPTEPEVVVVGVDGSEAGERAAHFAGRHAREGGATLVVAFVVPWSPYAVQTARRTSGVPPPRSARPGTRTPTIVDPLVEALVAEGVKAEGVVRHGHPAETLCDIAKERGATHLLVGRIGQSRVRTLLFGSTPGNLIQISTVPVTVVP
jgi:nucleotide-binding universal stress UspA family protein